MDKSLLIFTLINNPMHHKVLNKMRAHPKGEKVLNWAGYYKNRIEAVERGVRFQKWTKNFIYGFFCMAALGGLSFGAVKTMRHVMEKSTPVYTYKQFEEDENGERTNATVEHAKLIGTDDKKLTTEQLHEKYTYTYNEQGNVVPQVPEDQRAVIFLFGDSVGSSIIAWSGYFEIDPAIVVAIICAENGSSLDPHILNTVSRTFTQNPHFADRTISRSDARGIAQIKPSTGAVAIKELTRGGRWPFKTTNVYEVLSDYDMSIFLLCALIREIQKSGYSNIKDISGIYHSGHNGWGVKKRRGENEDEVWKQIKKANLAIQQYEGVRAYLSESIKK